MKVIFVPVGIENDVAVIQDRGVDGLGKYVPLTTIRRAFKPRVGGNFQVACIDEQAGVTDVFNLHFLVAAIMARTWVQASLEEVTSGSQNLDLIGECRKRDR